MASTEAPVELLPSSRRTPSGFDRESPEDESATAGEALERERDRCDVPAPALPVRLDPSASTEDESPRIAWNDRESSRSASLSRDVRAAMSPAKSE